VSVSLRKKQLSTQSYYSKRKNSFSLRLCDPVACFAFRSGAISLAKKKAITSGAGAAVRIHTYILSFGERHIIWSIGPIAITGGRGPPAESNQTPRAIVPITK